MIKSMFGFLGNKKISDYEVIEGNNLVGKFVVASPNSRTGDCFDKSVVFIISQDSKGTIGLITNRIVSSVNTSMMFKALDLSCPDIVGKEPLHFGGPVESEKGMILHSSDYVHEPLIKVNEELILSSNKKILKDIAEGAGPKDKMLVLGYVGWSVNQLEEEIKKNSWIVVPYDKDLIFSENNFIKWQTAYSNAGISFLNFVTTTGNA